MGGAKWEMAQAGMVKTTKVGVGMEGDGSIPVRLRFAFHEQMNRDEKPLVSVLVSSIGLGSCRSLLCTIVAEESHKLHSMWLCLHVAFVELMVAYNNGCNPTVWPSSYAFTSKPGPAYAHVMKSKRLTVSLRLVWHICPALLQMMSP